MPIRKHLTDKTAFGPAAIEAMSKAFEEACIALQVYAGLEIHRPSRVFRPRPFQYQMNLRYVFQATAL